MKSFLFKNFVLQLLYYYEVENIAIHTVTGETSQYSPFLFLPLKPENYTLTFLTQSLAAQVLLYFLQFQNHCFAQVLQGAALLYQVLPKGRKHRI